MGHHPEPWWLDDWLRPNPSMASRVIKKLKRMMPLARTIGSKPDDSSVLQDDVEGTVKVQTSCVPDGHFYSPIPSHAEVRRNEERIFRIPEHLSAIDLNIDEQLRTLKALAEYYDEIPFQTEKTQGLRYFLKNPMFGFADGICLYGLIRHLKPKRIIEVGAGYSSCVMLDTNERFFANSISCTLIEPNPESFLSLIVPADLNRIQLLRTPLQDVDPGTFLNLSANDILFIDSSHVSKAGSDVNQLVFEVLPELQSGVYVHFHDVFYPLNIRSNGFATWVFHGTKHIYYEPSCNTISRFASLCLLTILSAFIRIN